VHLARSNSAELCEQSQSRLAGGGAALIQRSPPRRLTHKLRVDGFTHKSANFFRASGIVVIYGSVNNVGGGVPSMQEASVSSAMPYSRD
jgi:hypothetical protein